MVMMDLLIVYEDGRREKMQQKVPFTLGRSTECEARVPHWRVAKRHIRVTRGGDGLQVEDLGSLYGTRVNGRKFSICDPTPQKDDLLIGQISSELSKTAFQVVYEYIPTSK